MDAAYLAVALKAVKAAEAVILDHLTTDLRTEYKADNSPVTVADRQAEQIIKQVIRAEFPEHTYYGEEGEKVDLANHHGCTWIIDPIDCTKGYIRGGPIFATQLALLQDGELVVGVSNAPMLGELMYAQKGSGCFFNGNPVHVSKTAELDQTYLSFGSLKYFVQNHTMDQLLSLVQQVRWPRGFGDFWAYHLLVRGTIDVAVEADVAFWDIAAVKVLIEEAGGRVTQQDGKPVTHQSTTFLASNGVLHDVVVDHFNA